MALGLLLQSTLPKPHKRIPKICFSIKLRVRHAEKSACKMSLVTLEIVLMRRGFDD